MKAALDTTYILGRGAVKDTYNLLAEGIVQVVRALAALEDVKAEEWSKTHELERYFGSSVKGDAAIDWDDAKARRAFLKHHSDRCRPIIGSSPAGTGMLKS